ncbi:MAG: hypothetical protein ACOCXJ_02910 [Planctomycetota bacterium]
MPYLMLALLLLLTACGGSRPTVSADDLLQLRRYRLELGDPEPQASWSPSGRWLLARWGRGLAMVREGMRHVHRLENARRPGWPVWLSDSLVAVGAEEWFVTTPEDRVVPPSQSIRLLDAIPGTGFRNPRDLADASGWRPRPWQGDIVAQSANAIWVYDASGTGRLYDEAFFPAPQRNGDGMIVQSRPVIAPDHWTGGEGPGELVIRWPDAPVQLVPGCILGRWTPQGGVLAIRLTAAPPATGPWWSGGSEVVHIPAPGAEPIPLLANAHFADAHPILPLIACADNGGNIVLVHADGSGVIAEVAEHGERPLWSPDGRDLCFEVPTEDGTAKDLMVVVYKLR